MRKVLKKLPPESLMSFIVTDGVTNVIKIRFDDLCDHLIINHHRSFNVGAFERKLQDEINNKLIGKPITKNNLLALCKYIDELGIYMSNVKTKTLDGDIPKDAVKEFFAKNEDKYKEALQKAKKRNPEEYQTLLEKYKKRLE